MDLFAYILILTSVIYALAVAQVLEGVSRIAQSPTPVRAFAIGRSRGSNSPKADTQGYSLRV